MTLSIAFSISASIFIISFLISFINYLSWYHTIKSFQCQKAKMEISLIKKLYAVKPRRWTVERLTILSSHRLLYYNAPEQHQRFLIIPIGGYPAYLWLKRKCFLYQYRMKYQNNTIQEKENLKTILEIGQKDIDEMRQQAEKKIKTAKEIALKAKENI